MVSVRTPSQGRRASYKLLMSACLLAPCLAVLWVPLYAESSSVILGIPFFYAYQLLWVLVTPGLLAISAWARTRSAVVAS